MQAIVTKYLGPTNSRGSRVKATCQAGSITVSWDDAWDVFPNHRAAALALVKKLGWDSYPGTWHDGCLPDDTGYVFVYASNVAPEEE
jgi:hypothetical protein